MAPFTTFTLRNGMLRVNAAFSLPEALVVIAVIGVLAAIGIPSIAGLIPSSKKSTAERNLNLINGAVNQFANTFWDITESAGGNTAEEVEILRSLQYQSTNNPVPGTPFLDPGLSLVATSDTSTYRAYWNGTFFRMYPAGVSGSGIDLLRLSEQTNRYSYPSNYQLVGAP